MIPYYAIILFDEADAWNESWEIRTFPGVVESGGGRGMGGKYGHTLLRP